MAEDALDPGPLGNYPFWPRRPSDGKPAGFGHEPNSQGDVEAEERMRRGVSLSRDPQTLEVLKTIVIPTDPVTGEQIVPPTIPPTP